MIDNSLDHQGSFTYFAHDVEDVEVEELLSGTMIPFLEDYRSNISSLDFNIIREPIRRGNQTSDLRSPRVANFLFFAGEVTGLHEGQDRRIVTVVNNYFAPDIWSHFLMDNVFPIFRLLKLFERDDFSRLVVEPLFISNPCPHKLKRECAFSEHTAPWMDILTNKQFDIEQLQKKYANATSERPVCFRKVFTGLSLFSDHGLGASGHGRNLQFPDFNLWGVGADLLAFRDRVFRHHKLADAFFGSKLKDIVFLRKGTKHIHKDGSHHIEIISSWFERAKCHFSNQTVESVVLENLDIRSQIETAARSKVIISQEGSTAFGALWLPPGSTLVILHENIYQKLDYYLWTNVLHFHVVFLHIAFLDERFIPVVAGGLYRFDRQSSNSNRPRGHVHPVDIHMMEVQKRRCNENVHGSRQDGQRADQMVDGAMERGNGSSTNVVRVAEPVSEDELATAARGRDSNGDGHGAGQFL